MAQGSLTVVGTGIRAVGQVTLEAASWIEKADRVLYHVADPVTENWLKSLNAKHESLGRFYEPHKARIHTYKEMVAHILLHVRQDLNVCVVFYGHPGLFVWASHEAIRQARKEGYGARMLPGVSSTDCLFADLGIDPSISGCQFLEATDFLIRDRILEISGAVVLWQIGVVGDIGYNPEGVDVKKLELLREALERYYGPQHEVIIYEASPFVVCEPRLERIPLSKLAECNVTSLSTLFIPPLESRSLNLDMIEKLGIKVSIPNDQEEVVK